MYWKCFFFFFPYCILITLSTPNSFAQQPIMPGISGIPGDHSVISENPDLIIGNPDLIIGNPDLIIENPERIIEYPEQIIEYPEQIIEDPDLIIIKKSLVPESQKKVSPLDTLSDQQRLSFELELTNEFRENFPDLIGRSPKTINIDEINNLDEIVKSRGDYDVWKEDQVVLKELAERWYALRREIPEDQKSEQDIQFEKRVLLRCVQSTGEGLNPACKTVGRLYAFAKVGVRAISRHRNSWCGPNNGERSDRVEKCAIAGFLKTTYCYKDGCCHIENKTDRCTKSNCKNTYNALNGKMHGGYSEKTLLNPPC